MARVGAEPVSQARGRPAVTEPDRLPIGVRAFAPPPPAKPHAEPSRKVRSGKPAPPSDWTLVFDTETTAEIAPMASWKAWEDRHVRFCHETTGLGLCQRLGPYC